MKRHTLVYALVALTLGGCGSRQVQDAPPEPGAQTEQDEPPVDEVVAEDEQEQVKEEPAPEVAEAPAKPEEPAGPPEVTFDDIVSKKLQPGLVQLKARAIKEVTPKKGGGADPCVPWTLLMDTTDSIVNKMFPAEGIVTGYQGMIKEVPYTFVLELEEGYGEKLATESCNPDDLGVKLVGCVDCDEQKVPILTIGQLKASPIEPGFVLLEAYFSSTNTPGPCPKMSHCEPAVETTTLSAGTEPGSDYIMVTGHPAEPKKLKKTKMYTFLLQLQEEYESGLNHPTSDPRVNKIKMRRVVQDAQVEDKQGSLLASKYSVPMAPANDDWAKKCKKKSDCVLTTFTQCCAACTCTAEPYAINRKILENQHKLCSIVSCGVLFSDGKPCPPCPEVPEKGAKCVKGTCTVIEDGTSP